MARHLRTVTIVVTLATALVAAGPARGATWAALPSGTTDTITTINYRGPSAYWYATTTGKIFKNGVPATVSGGGVPINRIAMSPDGTTGIAVGNGGAVFRSTDSGTHWAAVAGIFTHPNTNCSGAAGSVAQISDNLTGLSWADANTVYADGPTSNFLQVQPVLKSTNGGATWTDNNRNSSGTCLVSEAGAQLTDVAAAPGSSTVYLIGRNFGESFVSYNGLGSVAKQGSAVNHYQGQPQIAVAAENPNVVYAIDREADGLALNFALSTNSAMTYSSFVFGNADKNLPALYGVAASGSTMVAAGDAGRIYMSTDAQTAYRISDTGPFATTAWRAASLASPTGAAVAGAGGVIAYATDVNAIPDTIAPSGSISAPGTVSALKPASFSATLADNAGGSGIDASSISWSATGPGSPVTGAGNPTTLTFPVAGVWTVTVSFKDLAGNPATASRSVTVGTPPPSPAPAKPKTKTRTTTVSVPGAKISFGVPRACVRSGKTFTVTLSWKKQRRKGNKFIKITRTDFYIGTKRVKIDRKAPFRQRLKVKASTKPGSKVTVRARAYMKVKHGKQPTKSISTTITTCK